MESPSPGKRRASGGSGTPRSPRKSYVYTEDEELKMLGEALAGSSDSIKESTLQMVIDVADLREMVESKKLVVPDSEITPVSFSAWAMQNIAVRESMHVVLNIYAAFDNADADGGGHLDIKETDKMLRVLGFTPSDTEVQECFNILDTDGGASIDFVEFLAAISSGQLDKTGITLDKIHELAEISTFNLTEDVNDLDADARIARLPVLERGAYNILKHQHHRGLMKMEKRAVVVKDAAALEKLQELKSVKEVHNKALHYEKLDDEKVKTFSDMALYCVLRAFLAGCISCAAAASVELLATHLFEIDDSEYSEQGVDILKTKLFWNFWLLNGAGILISTCMEIAYIYWDTLNTACRMCGLVGLSLYPPDPQRVFIATGIVKDSLELPFEAAPKYGIDPMFGRSKFIEQISLLIYKAKSGVTTFVIKVLAKRLFARAIAKGALSVRFVGIPVIGFWNGMVAYWVMEAVKVDILGPPCATRLFDDIVPTKKLSEKQKESVIRAIACTVPTQAQWNPNIEILLKHAMARLKVTAEMYDAPEDPQRLMAVLRTEGVRPVALRTAASHKRDYYAWYALSLAVILGKVNTKATNLYRDALVEGGFYARADNIFAASTAFNEGRLTRRLLRDCCPTDKEDLVELSTAQNVKAWVRWFLRLITI